MSPPRLAALLLRLVLRNQALWEAILGDLEEELGRLRDHGSPPERPRIWYWRAILGLGARFAIEAIPGGGRQSSGSPVTDAREVRPMFETLAQDLRYAGRGLVKSPVFAVVAVLTLAVGIGANVAMFSIVEPTLLRPLPYEESENLVLALGTVEGESWTQTVSAHDYVDLRERATAFESLGAQTAWPWFSSVTGGDEPLRLPVSWVSVNLFRTLRLNPVLGRHFLEEEGEVGAPNVAMVSHALWAQNFGSDREIVGRSATIDGIPFTIVGVMPAGFRLWTDCDIWMPMRLGEGFASDRRYQNFAMVGRLQEGTPLEQAQSQADVVAADLRAEFPTTNEGEGFRITELQEALTQSYRTSLLLLLGGVGVLLLIACGNLAALFLARGFTRRTEFSVRVALGASRRRVLRQVLTESLVVAGAGGVLGTLAALGLHRLLMAGLPFDLPPYTYEAGISGPMLAVALFLTVTTGVLIGIIPAVRSAGRDMVEGLKVGRRASDFRGTRIRSGLVIAQVALSMVLMVGSGLMIRSFAHLRGVDTGFDAEGLLAADLDLPASEYGDADRRIHFFTSLEEKLRAIPGVADVGLVNRLPIRTGGGNTYVYPVGERPPAGEQVRTANERWVMPGYFEAMGIPVLRGRGIEAADGPDAPPVLVINETMASVFFPGEDPLGRTIIIDYDEATPLEVVGIVGDVRFSGPAGQLFQAMYRSYRQEPVTRMAVVVRTAGNPGQVIPAMRAAVRELDTNLPVSEVDRMEQLVARTMGDQSVMAVILSLFAWVAVFLTALGLYGVLAYHVSQRVPELGLRMALGADSSRVVRMVAIRGLGLLLAGMALGVAGSLGATRFLQNLLFGVRPTDPVTLLVISGLFGVVGLAACVLPARRAVKVDPAQALQSE
jgi:predicted permease